MGVRAAFRGTRFCFHVVEVEDRVGYYAWCFCVRFPHVGGGELRRVSEGFRVDLA